LLGALSQFSTWAQKAAQKIREAALNFVIPYPFPQAGNLDIRRLFPGAHLRAQHAPAWDKDSCLSP